MVHYFAQLLVRGLRSRGSDAASGGQQAGRGAVRAARASGLPVVPVRRGRARRDAARPAAAVATGAPRLGGTSQQLRLPRSSLTSARKRKGTAAARGAHHYLRRLLLELLGRERLRSLRLLRLLRTCWCVGVLSLRHPLKLAARRTACRAGRERRPPRTRLARRLARGSCKQSERGPALKLPAANAAHQGRVSFGYRLAPRRALARRRGGHCKNDKFWDCHRWHFRRFFGWPREHRSERSDVTGTARCPQLSARRSRPLAAVHTASCALFPACRYAVRLWHAVWWRREADRRGGGTTDSRQLARTRA